jgi:hypothetical protein
MSRTAHDWSLGEPARKRVPTFTALAAAAELTVPQIPRFAEQATTDLMRLADAHRLPIIAPPVFVYTGPGTGAHDTFLLRIAMPVPDNATLADHPGEQAIVTIEPFDCLAFDYRGPMQHIGRAYPLAMNRLRELGHRPAEPSREVYKHWVAYDAPDNITEIQLGLA